MLCSKVTEAEIQYFINCIEKSRNVKYLKFLQTIVKGGKGSRRAQEMIMNEVMWVWQGCGLGREGGKWSRYEVWFWEGGKGISDLRK